ncbi:MAG: alcohol dehydrogenase catalytic domain-containing protein [Rhizomicrobium sp.]
MKAIRFEKTGGPEVLDYVDVELPAPGPGQARVRHTVIGVNFIDTYQRSGLYKLPLPSGLGSEAAGVVESVGPGVTTLKPGDRVAYAGAPGAYSEANNIPRRAAGEDPTASATRPPPPRCSRA